VVWLTEHLSPLSSQSLCIIPVSLCDSVLGPVEHGRFAKCLHAAPPRALTKGYRRPFFEEVLFFDSIRFDSIRFFELVNPFAERETGRVGPISPVYYLIELITSQNGCLLTTSELRFVY
jgi:hypothetical protein